MFTIDLSGHAIGRSVYSGVAYLENQRYFHEQHVTIPKMIILPAKREYYMYIN